MRPRSALLLAAALLSSLAATRSAAAQAAPPTAAPASTSAPAPTAEQTAKAKTLFDLGAKAYDSENFPAAIQAFQEAYRLSQRPGPIFSTAQSYRRLYNTDRKVETLRQAVAYYKLYIEKQKAGGRIGEAQQALRDLEPVLAEIGSSASAAPAVAAPDSKPRTRLMVSSPTPGAMASLDGGELAEMPLIQEISTGEHTLRLVADGFIDHERKLNAREGEVYGLDIPLQEKPAFLTLRADSGAAISIDGRSEGTTPLLNPLKLTSGVHLVSVLKNGHRSYSAEIEFRRDEKRSLEIQLDRTPQRDAAFGMLGTAGAGLIASGVLGALSLEAQGRAEAIEKEKRNGNIDAERRAEHQTAVATRDDMRLAAISAFGAAGLFAVIGAGLYLFDRPSPGVPTRLRDEAPPKPPQANKRPPKVGMTVAPIIGPTVGGALLEFRF